GVPMRLPAAQTIPAALSFLFFCASVFSSMFFSRALTAAAAGLAAPLASLAVILSVWGGVA
ncbi:MAG: hypothetical protein ACE5HV_06295, partial [Acidobacteriota bacterium]